MAIQASFSLMIFQMAWVCTSRYYLELRVLISSKPSSTCLLLTSGDWKLFRSSVILLLISVDLRQANSLAPERADLILRVIVISLCSLGASEKESGVKANFSALQRQKKKLGIELEVVLIILMVCVLSLPNCTISGSIVTTSDRISLLLKLNNYKLFLKHAYHIYPISSLQPQFSIIQGTSPWCLVSQQPTALIIDNIQTMSKQFAPLRDSKMHIGHIRDFTYSVDIKKFSRDRGNMTPLNHHSLYKKLQERSNEKNNRNSQPSSLAISFSKNISQKNMQTKRKLSSGFQFMKNNHHSVSIDQHLLKEKYNTIRELFEQEKYGQIIPQIRHIIDRYEYSNAQKNMFYWLAIALGHTGRYEQALEKISECLAFYPRFHEGLLCLAALHLKLKNYNLAVQYFQDAINLNHKNSSAYLQLATCYQSMQQFDKARDLLLGVIDKFPREAEMLMVLVECFIALRELEKCEEHIKGVQDNFNRKDSLFLYIRGRLQKQKGNDSEAYILFEESLKYNNNRQGVNKSLLQTVKIQIDRRDFYKAHHSIGRTKFLQLESSEQMQIYSILVEGVMTMMKKKSQESINILLKIAGNKKCEQLRVQSLINKYLAYGYFKISEYGKSIKYYQQLTKTELDESSQYNKLLAEGIELADRHLNIAEAVNKFNSAKVVYPQKVEPYIYIAMSYILKYNTKKEKDEIKKAETLIEALKEMEQGYKINPNSSNLLYHRTIIHLYFQDWEQAHHDINRCIEKAEENLPKYFFLRGVCYTCIKEFKKAINQFSICLSLDANFNEAYLEKAKCYFLLGNTEKGFGSLKIFMELNPSDLSIYRWIGDLLYQGMSYKDALKAYHELGEVEDIQTAIMKAKCLFRVGSLNEVISHLKIIQKSSLVEKQKITLDWTAINLLTSLLKPQNAKTIASNIKKLNRYLEDNIIGYVFQLIDCMNLLGVASFYLQKYADAYESFLLVLQLYQSLCEKEMVSLKSECCDEEVDLRSEDIYFNIIICQFAQGNVEEAVRMMSSEYLTIVSDVKKKKHIEKILKNLEKDVAQTFEWDFKNEKPINSKLKRLDVANPKVKLKTKPVFNLYHDSAANLYASSVAEKIINKLHASYIDNMPEGPWIKRNPYGVVFTEDVLPSENSISLEDTFRLNESKNESMQQSSLTIKQGEVEEEEEKKTISKKEEMLKKLKFDESVQAKLNNMMQKSNGDCAKKKECK